MYTDEQIKGAREIGGRPYHPCDWQGNPNGFQNSLISSSMPGITIRQELMRTAMLACGAVFNTKYCAQVTDEMLLQMAKDELGGEE